MMNDAIDRRGFLDQSTKTGLLAAGAAFGLSAVGQSSEVPSPEASPSNRVRIAVMGVYGRGRGLLSLFGEHPHVDIAYICEPDLSVVSKAMKVVTDTGRPAPEVVQDFRKALDDPTVDALVCAAPDHWHALATILACQAGKDVYVEKPASHRLDEGPKMIAAARKYDRVVQVGTQRRSGEDFISAVQAVREGRIGKVCMARAWSSKIRPDIGHSKVQPAPSDLDFNLWCGPAPNHGYRSNLVHYHWHWRWAYGTGELGNLGAHSIDVARWGLGVDFPTTVCSGGGLYGFDDDKETPDTQSATFDFGDKTIQAEQRMWSHRGLENTKGHWGVTFYGTDATLVTYASGWDLFQGEELIDSMEGTMKVTERAHIKNFLDCLVSRKRPNADIAIGHCSATLPHLANIAWRTRATIQFDPATETIVNNEIASKLAQATYRPGFELPVV